MIPFLDLHAAYRELAQPIDTAIARVMQSGWYILGPEVDRFEGAFADYVGARHCVGVGNGLEAISLSLRAIGIGPGDEVIVPSNTYIATWLAVTALGATPVPVEPDLSTYCLAPDRVEAAITARTKAMVPVHLYGHPADLETLLAICRKHGMRMVEDAAQSHGAALDGTRIGAHGDAVAWSFYPGKNLGAYGDAGGVTTNDPEIASTIRKLRNYGSSVKYVNEMQGSNSRLDPIQAAVLGAKLPALDEWNERRRGIAARYTEAFSGRDIVLPKTAKGATHAFHLYVVLHHARDRLQKSLRDLGVDTLIHYPIPPFRQQAYPGMADDAHRWPIADRIAQQALSLPIGPHLSEQQVHTVITAVHKALDEIER